LWLRAVVVGVVMLVAEVAVLADSALLRVFRLLLGLLIQSLLAQAETEHLLLVLETVIAEPAEQIRFSAQLLLQVAVLVVAGLLVKLLVLLVVLAVAVKKVLLVAQVLPVKVLRAHLVGKAIPTTEVEAAVQLLLERRVQVATLAVLVVQAQRLL
jgi:hypothetical protein